MSIFSEAAELEPHARGAVVARRAAGDVLLRAEVEAMLRHDAGGGSDGGGAGGIAESGGGRGAGGLRTGLGLALPIDAPVAMSFGHDGYAGAEAVMPRLAGRYRLLRVVGEGGMGVVYEAEQALPRRTVALKAVRKGLASRRVLARFVSEAHILGRLQHPGIAQIHEAGVIEEGPADQAYIVMEFVDGRPLTEHVRASAMSVDQKLALVAEICDAVQHAHQRRVVHRDLKPGNILVDREGRVKVLDFGVAAVAPEQAAEPEAADTNGTTGQIVGTLAYMAPEQLLGSDRPPDTRSDVYALGVVLFELLAGVRPLNVEAGSLPEAMRLISSGEPRRLRDAAPEAGADADAIAAKAMQKDPGARYQSVGELAEDLRRAIRREAVAARQDSSLYVLGRQLRRYRVPLAVAAAAVVGLTGFAGYAHVQARRVAGLYRESERQRERLDETAGELAAAVEASNIEQGRLLARAGNMKAAEDLIWPCHLAHPSQHSLWALREVYGRFGCDKTVVVGDAATTCAGASGDGRWVAVGTDRPEVVVLDGKTGAERARFEGVSAARLLFGSGGERLYAIASDGKVRVWNTAGWKKERGWELSGRPIGAACVVRAEPGGAGGDRLLIGDEGGQIRMVDGDSGKVVREVAGHAGGVRCAAVSSDERLLVTGGEDGDIRLWSLSDLSPLDRRSAHQHGVVAVCISPDASAVATGGADQLIRVWALRAHALSETPVEVEQRLSGPITDLTFSPDERALVSSGPLGADSWDPASGKRLAAPRREHAAAATFFSGEGSVLTVGVSGEVRYWPAASQTSHVRVIEPTETGGGGMAACSKNGETLVIASPFFSGMPVLDTATGVSIGRYESGNATVRGYRFSIDGERLVAALSDGSIIVWSTKTREVLARFSKGVPETGSVRFTPDASAIITSHMDGTVRWWDARDGHAVREVSTGQGEIIRSTMTQDGAIVAAQHRRGRVTMVNAVTGEVLGELPTEQATCVGFLPGGHELAVGDRNGDIEVWDVDRLKLERTLTGHGDSITVMAVTPTVTGPMLLASVCADGTARLWDPAGGFCLAEFELPGRAIANASLDETASRLVSSQTDGSVAIWDLVAADGAVRGNAEWARRTYGGQGRR
jgi:WD40 repeat protein/tRNA A-37 threonylcarbamoyl transferase component Bud32